MLLNKLSYRYLLLTFLLVFCPFSARAQDPMLESLEIKNNRIVINLTGIKDVKKLQEKLQVKIRDKNAKIIPGIIQLGELLSFEFKLPPGMMPGWAFLSVEYDEKQIDSRYVNIPHPLGGQGEQPELFRLEPEGGIEGATITIVGKKLGDHLNKVTIYLEKLEGDGKKAEISKSSALSISPPEKGNQEQQKLKFAIPTGKDLTGKHFISNRVRLRVIVNGQPSNYLRLNVVVTNWRIKIAILSAILILAFLVALAFAVKKLNFLKVLFVDKKTNTYSLSRCQAFGWTVILIGSYFYLAIGKGLIFGKGTIPDFSPSLLGLMLISYGGMLTARGISVKVPKNDLADTPLRLINLISEGGEVSLPRLQLVGFTIAAIIIYVYNLSGADLFVEGLPGLPPTLLGLLGISQTGYIGGKLVAGRLAVNRVIPKKVQLGRADVKLNIIGSGLVVNTKALVQDDHQLRDTEFINSNSLSLKLPKFSQAGWKQLVLIPPTDSSIVLDDVVEIIDAKIERVELISDHPRQIKLSLKGFNPREIKATIGGKPATVVSFDVINNLVTLEAEVDMKPNAIVKVTSPDEQFKAEMKVPQA